MAKHGFGIMDRNPEPSERFDVYEPEKYDCIFVNDDFIEPLLEELTAVDFYWHGLAYPGKGLAYCGITLIPPSSMEKVIGIISGEEGTDELVRLLQKAKEENKYIIHYGI